MIGAEEELFGTPIRARAAREARLAAAIGIEARQIGIEERERRIGRARALERVRERGPPPRQAEMLEQRIREEESRHRTQPEHNPMNPENPDAGKCIVLPENLPILPYGQRTRSYVTTLYQGETL